MKTEKIKSGYKRVRINGQRFEIVRSPETEKWNIDVEAVEKETNQKYWTTFVKGNDAFDTVREAEEFLTKVIGA